MEEKKNILFDTPGLLTLCKKIAEEMIKKFLISPQVLSNDLSRSLFPADQVKLLVVDEAHRAQVSFT